MYPIQILIKPLKETLHLRDIVFMLLFLEENVVSTVGLKIMTVECSARNCMVVNLPHLNVVTLA